MTEKRIKQAYDAICPPHDASVRIQQKIEAELGKALNEITVTVKPRRNPLPVILGTAAAVALVLGGTALLFWPLLRPGFVPTPLPERPIDAERPAETLPPELTPPPVHETSAPEPEDRPAPEPDYELGAIADEGTVTAENGHTLSWAVDKNNLLLIRGTGRMEDYYGDYHWLTSWPDQLPWQGYLASAQTVVMEPGLSSIAAYAFADFRELTEAVIPEGVTSIGNQAFYSCSRLENAAIPDGVELIGEGAFFNNMALTMIEIPESVRTIGTRAFSGCRLKSVTVPGGVESLGDYAFSFCNWLETATLREGVKEIGAYAFCNCNSLKSVTIPDSVTAIADGAFGYCEDLSDVYYAGSEEQWAQIKTGIGNDYLKSAEIHFHSVPEDRAPGLTSWPATAPSYELGTVVDRDTLTKEGTLPGESLTWALDDKGLLRIGGLGTMDTFFHLERNNEYFAIPWSKYAESIHYAYLESGQHSVGYCAFDGCSSLTEVVIPESVNRIRYAAFRDCTALETLSIPGGVTAIEGMAFSGSGLKSIVIPEGVTTIEAGTFADCKNLRSVELPDSMTMIYPEAFYSCKRLPSVTIPEGVYSIGERAFHSCFSLTSIRIPLSMKGIGSYAFAGCINLTDVYYAGSEEQWNQILIGDFNMALLNAEIHFNSEG